MRTNKIHLLCNAHLDPVWLWEWEEAAAEAIATFRTAADLCEQFEGFIFNHNEAALYKWVAEYDPALFQRIQKLVRQGKWHIMGGWYLQPDCNMPSGESFVRQILLGRRYFKKQFGVEVTTAVNFDSFGHSRGLPQILVKSGYDSYLFCRPEQDRCRLPGNDFVWVGCDGSEVLASRVVGMYGSRLGKAHEKIIDRMHNHPDRPSSLVAWGVGNHGGGPSRADLRRITRLIRGTKDFEIIHSTPEDYFKELAGRRAQLPRHRRDLNPWAVGCYTSQVRIKQKHRRLENELYSVEKMACAAAYQGLMAYPRAEIHEALHDLMLSEFHDILPGSSIQPAEEASLRLLDHGLEVLSRAKARAFLALTRGQPKARAGEIPVLVYNPHPYRVRTIVECEFQLPDINWEDVFTLPTVYGRRRRLASQVEKEDANVPLDWRKRIVFAADLEPAQMNRFNVRLQVLERRPKPALKARNGRVRFKTEDLEVVINTRTGLVDRYRVAGVDYLAPRAFQPIVIMDNEDAWGTTARRFRKVVGRFRLMSRKQGTRFSGVKAHALPSVRVIEDGPVRSVVEAVLAWGDSAICQRYKLPKQGTEIEVETRVHWNEKDRMLKLGVPTLSQDSLYLGQLAYGVGELPANGDEAVAQKWVALVSGKDDMALTCINEGVYGSDYSPGSGLRLTLLRSPAFSGHPILDRPMVVQDRYRPRIDQGERVFRFWLNGGGVRKRLGAVDREALARNEKPIALPCYPSGTGRKPKPGAILSDGTVQMTTMKRAEDGDDLIVRLFEPTGTRRSTVLSLPFAGVKTKVSLSAFEIKTLRINVTTGRVAEVNLLEN